MQFCNSTTISDSRTSLVFRSCGTEIVFWLTSLFIVPRHGKGNTCTLVARSTTKTIPFSANFQHFYQHILLFDLLYRLTWQGRRKCWLLGEPNYRPCPDLPPSTHETIHPSIHDGGGATGTTAAFIEPSTLTPAAPLYSCFHSLCLPGYLFIWSTWSFFQLK